MIVGWHWPSSLDQFALLLGQLGLPLTRLRRCTVIPYVVLSTLPHSLSVSSSLSHSYTLSVYYCLCHLDPGQKYAPQFCQFITRCATNKWMNEMPRAPQWNVSNNNNSSSNCNSAATTRTKTITTTTTARRDHKKCINLMESFPLLCTLYGHDFCRALRCCCCKRSFALAHFILCEIPCKVKGFTALLVRNSLAANVIIL